MKKKSKKKKKKKNKENHVFFFEVIFFGQKQRDYDKRNKICSKKEIENIEK